jgi:hypothetical protein
MSKQLCGRGAQCLNLLGGQITVDNRDVITRNPGVREAIGFHTADLGVRATVFMRTLTAVF